jgi:hypothetical protein
MTVRTNNFLEINKSNASKSIRSLYKIKSLMLTFRFPTPLSKVTRKNRLTEIIGAILPAMPTLTKSSSTKNNKMIKMKTKKTKIPKTKAQKIPMKNNTNKKNPRSLRITLL